MSLNLGQQGLCMQNYRSYKSLLSKFTNVHHLKVWQLHFAAAILFECKRMEGNFFNSVVSLYFPYFLVCMSGKDFDVTKQQQKCLQSLNTLN